MNTSKLACGIMSGTSLDGIDVAIASISGSGLETKIELISGKTYPYPRAIYEKVKLAIEEKLSIRDLSSLNFELGKLYANVVKDLCAENKIQTSSLSFIASHGQTIYHQAYGDEFRPPSTLQIGSGSVIANLTQTTVVSDFRIADMIAGGQGAPLVPFVDYCLFSDPRKNRILQNIGGISNITYLSKSLKTEDVLAFDTGPGNMMINRAMEVCYQLPYDESGKKARTGKKIDALYNEVMEHPYFLLLPPKSTGRESFGVEYTDQLVRKYAFEKHEDIVHTMTIIAADSMIQSIKKFVLKKSSVDELIISGGGVHNKFLMELLTKGLPDIRVLSSDDLNFSSDFKEALAFMILGNQTLLGLTSNLKEATGALKNVILGTVSYYK